MQNNIRIGKSGDKDINLVPRMLNRHGLVAGATGTGKTLTLRVMAEGLSRIGVPVLLADMKGDLSGISVVGSRKDFEERAHRMSIPFKFEDFPCNYWDIYEENGVAIKAPVREVGSFLLSRTLSLSRVQSSVLDLAFAISHDKNFKLDTLKDLKNILKYMTDFDEELFDSYGTFYPSTIGAILRAVINIEQQGGDLFFNSPSLDLNQMIQKEGEKGVINILSCTELVKNPLMYSTFIIWLLEKLYTELPEVGDIDKPKFVLFFDESHLIFEDCNKAVVSKVSQIVRLVRSKGVGIFFISQTPSDIPDKVLTQLSNRVQHSLRAFTPDEMRAVKVAAKSFRPNPKFDTEDCIMSLGVGEALISTLDDSGIPTVVERTSVIPPSSSLDILTSEQISDYILAHSDRQNPPKNGLNIINYDRIPQKQKQAEKRQQNGSQNISQQRYSYYGRDMRVNEINNKGRKEQGMASAVVGGILDGIFRMW